MSLALTEKVLQVLQDAGLDAVAAYPGKKMPALAAPCAAVQLQQAVLAQHMAQVLITVVSPAKLGGSVCESTAAAAAAVLQKAGAKCQVAGCSYDSTAGYFCAQVQAEVYGDITAGTWSPDMTVLLGSVQCKSAVAVEFWRATDEEVTVLSNACWHFRMEELFAPGGAEETGPSGTFVLTVQHNGRSEKLTGCSFTEHRREHSPSGIRQIREGIAQAYTVTAQ